jgi:hypothetical protein
MPTRCHCHLPGPSAPSKLSIHWRGRSASASICAWGPTLPPSHHPESLAAQAASATIPNLYHCGWGSRKARGDADSVPRAPLDPPLWTVVPNSNKALSLALAGPTKTQRMALLRCLRGLRQLFQASASGLRQFFRERRFRLLMRTRLVLSAAFLRGNGVIRRTQKVIQGDDNGHVGRPC